MFWPSKKPSVNDSQYKWILVDWNHNAPYPDAEETMVELYQQFHIQADSYIEHYRLKVNGKWVKPTYYGESAWMKVERVSYDKYRTILGVR